MPAVAIEQIPVEQQALLFLDINKNQKPVPPDLVWDLKGELRPNTPDGKISRIAKALNEKGGYSKGRYIPLLGRQRFRQLKLSGICMAIKKQRLTDRVLRDKMENPFYHKKEERLTKAVKKSIFDALDIGSKCFNARHKREFWHLNSGMAVFLALISKMASINRGIPTLQYYRVHFKKIAAYMQRYNSKRALGALRQRCNSEGGRDEVVDELLNALDLGGKPLEYFNRIAKVERAFASLVARLLSAQTNEWFVQRVPEDVRNKVYERIGPNDRG